MLTRYDITMMEDTVRDIISMWDMRLTVLKPLPIDQQPNWNEHMHEYSGEIHYIQYDNVAMERKDQTNTNIYDFDIKLGAGDDKDGYLVFAIPSKIPSKTAALPNMGSVKATIRRSFAPIRMTSGSGENKLIINSAPINSSSWPGRSIRHFR